MGTDPLSTIVARTLHAVLQRFGADQIFLFAPSGDPFWVARDPVTPAELVVFTEALDLLAELERTHQKPFAFHAPEHSYSVAALAPDSDLFIILIDGERGGATAEARVGLIRDALLPKMEHLRTSTLRSAAGG